MKRIIFIIIAMVLVALIATSAYFVLSHHCEAKRATDLLQMMILKAIANIAHLFTVDLKKPIKERLLIIYWLFNWIFVEKVCIVIALCKYIEELFLLIFVVKRYKDV